METILSIEIITLFSIFIVGAFFCVANIIMDTIKKYQKEKVKNNFNQTDKF